MTERSWGTRVLVGFCLLLFLTVPGCRVAPRSGPATTLDLETFAARQATRASLLRLLESGGTIEIRRKDEDGETSFDDCAMELWRDGDRFALRLRKLGERFLWVGADGTRSWVFELFADPVRLVILPPETGGEQALGSELLLFGPEQLLLLAGLEPLDPAGARPLPPDDSGRWRVAAPGPVGTGWSEVVWSIDPDTLLPARITALGEAGAPLLSATLRDYEPIRARDQPVGAWPQFPGKVRVETSDGRIDVRLFFNRPGATGSRLRDALFDLDALMRTFKPGLVEYVR